MRAKDPTRISPAQSQPDSHTSQSQNFTQQEAHINSQSTQTLGASQANQSKPGTHKKESSLEERIKIAQAGGGESRIAAQHQRGKLTARKRIELLVDPESFFEMGQLVRPFQSEQNSHYTDGVITGMAEINGRTVALYAQDFTIMGGSLGKKQGEKIAQLMDKAVQIGCPIIGLIDSGGARIPEGVHALAGYGDIFMRNVRYSGIVPQIAVILGPCAGGAAYSPALCDLIFSVEKISQLFITGPSVIKQVTGEQISKEDLGGSIAHGRLSGLVHHVSPTESACFESLREILGYLPSNYRSEPPDISMTSPESAEIKNSQANESLRTLVPDNFSRAYDIKHVIAALTDTGDYFEIHEQFAPNIVTVFGRINGKTVGIVGNQPLCKAGTIDIDASCKAARFINLCDTFSLPLLSLVDVPGFLPGVDQEHGGIIRHGAKLLAAYARATVPKITVILRKSFGGAYIVMGSKHLGADFVYAWPDAQIAVLGAPAAVEINKRRVLNACTTDHERDTLKKQYESEYTEEFLHPYVAAEHGYIDGVITPDQTRETIVRALQISDAKVEHLPAKKRNNDPI